MDIVADAGYVVELANILRLSARQEPLEAVLVRFTKGGKSLIMKAVSGILMIH